MAEHDTALATNRAEWNHVAKYFHGSTALPEGAADVIGCLRP